MNYITDTYSECGFLRCYRPDDAPHCKWRVAVDSIPNIQYGQVWQTLLGEAVTDDFGTLVLVGGLQ